VEGILPGSVTRKGKAKTSKIPAKLSFPDSPDETNDRLSDLIRGELNERKKTMNEILMNRPAIIRPADELAGLAKQINAEHVKVETALRAGLEHARSAGELLNKAKASMPHGEWLRWLKANCSVAERTARAYMAVACRWDELQTKSATVADLTFREAAKLLSNRAKVGDEQPDDPALAPFNSALAEFRQFFNATDEADFGKPEIAKAVGALHDLVIAEARKVCPREDRAKLDFMTDLQQVLALLHKYSVVSEGLAGVNIRIKRIIDGILNRADDWFLRLPEDLRGKLAEELGVRTGADLLILLASDPKEG
jgi:hypothetical protein